MSKRNLNRSSITLLKAPRSALRRMTADEKRRAGISAGADYFIDASKPFRKNAPRITVSRKKDFDAGVSHSKAAKLREQGLLNYKSAAARENAAKAKPKLREIQRLKKKVLEVRAVSRPPSSRNRAPTYRTSDTARRNYWRLRNRKLRGEHLDDGDWHQMIDIANATNDPALSRLMKS
jgi:hypothetical protein